MNDHLPFGPGVTVGRVYPAASTVDCHNLHEVERAWNEYARQRQQTRIAPIGGDLQQILKPYQPMTPEQREASIQPAAPSAPSAPALLDKAAQLMIERGKQYDKPEGERSMGKAVAAFNAITGRDLSEPEGWLLLQVLKDVRLFQRDGYHADSAEDCIAYAALKAEAKARE
jgi:hypothetical protein